MATCIGVYIMASDEQSKWVDIAEKAHGIGVNNAYATHGSPYDRGAADSYYGRVAQPHKLSSEGERQEQLTAAEIAEYYKGYGSVDSMDRKQWD